MHSIMTTYLRKAIGTPSAVLAAFVAAAFIERTFFRVNKDRAIYCAPSLQDPRHPLATHIEKILQARPNLKNPNYNPPFWAFNSWINILVFVLKQRFSTYFDHRNQLLHRDYLPTDDGTTTRLSIDSLREDNDDDNLYDVKLDAPLLLILPTITGSGSSHTYLMKMAAARGWRPLCLNRRGLADELDTARFNVMGDQDDTILQVQYVRKKYNNATFVGMMGLSAGSGLLVNYLGASGSSCGVDAACCLCPAYDVESAFKNFHHQYPKVDGLLLRDVKKKYVLANEKMLREYNSDAVDACLEADSIDTFLHAHIPFTGSSNEKEYFKRSNPMAHVFGIRIPVMILNSEDDMVCLPENIREDLAAECGGVLLLRTAEGSHIAYTEGWNGGGNYLVRTSLEFLEGAREVGATVEEF